MSRNSGPENQTEIEISPTPDESSSLNDLAVFFYEQFRHPGIRMISECFPKGAPSPEIIIEQIRAQTPFGRYYTNSVAFHAQRQELSSREFVIQTAAQRRQLVAQDR